MWVDTRYLNHIVRVKYDANMSGGEGSVILCTTGEAGRHGKAGFSPFPFLNLFVSTMPVLMQDQLRQVVRQITDPFLLKKSVLFLADTMGNPTSLHSIGKMIAAEGDVDEGKKKTHPAVNTVKAYVGALLDSFVFYEAKRFDIQGREYLSLLMDIFM